MTFISTLPNCPLKKVDKMKNYFGNKTRIRTNSQLREE